jgi:hypothetical protein
LIRWARSPAGWRECHGNSWEIPLTFSVFANGCIVTVSSRKKTFFAIYRKIPDGCDGKVIAFTRCREGKAVRRGEVCPEQLPITRIALVSHFVCLPEIFECRHHADPSRSHEERCHQISRKLSEESKSNSERKLHKKVNPPYLTSDIG